MPAKRTLRKASKKYPGVFERVIDGKGTGRFFASYHDPAKGGKAWVKGGPWPNPQAAAQARIERLGQLQRGPSLWESVTLNAYYETVYQPWYEANHKPGAAKANRYALRTFFARFGSQQMNNLDELAVRQWGLSCPLAYAKAARAFLYHAKDNRVLRDNPLARLGRAETRGRADIDIISEEELLELAETAVEALGPIYAPVFRAHILFSAYTCMRPAEVVALLKENVLSESVRVRDNESGGVLVSTPKNGQWREVLLPPPARRTLDAMPQNASSSYVFPALRGQRMTKGTQYNYWNATRIAYAAKTGDPSWRDKDFYEVTRHFGGSYLLNVLELPPELVAFQLGHTGQTGVDLVLRLYGHPDHKRWRERMMSSWRELEARQDQPGAFAERPRLRFVQGQGGTG